MLSFFTPPGPPAKQQAVADAYVPVLRGVAAPASLYYLFITYGHYRDEAGFAFYVLAGLSLGTAILLQALNLLLRKARPSLRRIEALGLLMNALFLANVLAYFAFHFEEPKLVYFVFLTAIFSTAGASLRVIAVSVAAATAAFYAIASRADPEIFHQYIWLDVAGSFVALGMSTLMRKAILLQVESRLKADELTRQAESRAATDALTGLANRPAIFAQIERLVAERRPFWFGLIDLDGFKAINDLYGHVAGDGLLREVAARLSRPEIAGLTIGRLGGDEFAAVVEQDLPDRQIEKIGNGLIESVRQSIPHGPRSLIVSASAGFAHFPEAAETAAGLYEKADFALYKAKENQRGHTLVFSRVYQFEIVEHSRIERAFRESDLAGELFLAFQPQHNIVTGRIVGFEALARWRSASIGLIPPDKFIRAAERSGHIGEITRILFKKALQALASWPREVRLSFNLSLHDISSRDTMAWVVEQIRASGLDPARIDFEVTETAVMYDFELSRRSLAMLGDFGCRIALDDFGSGHSSFEYIDRLPLHKIKIDKSFVAKLGHSRVSLEIVKAVLTLCQRLELDCVVEGVETAEELEVLRGLGAQLIQGYLFGRPVDGSKIAALLRDAGRRISA